MKQLKNRTDKKIRPWIQGFWYTPAEINAQIDGLLKAETTSWSVWNPSGNYKIAYTALANRLDRTFPQPQFYPPVADLCEYENRITPGNARIVNLTDYRQGYTIISLEEPQNGSRQTYSTLMEVMDTIDEGIMDRILTTREIPYTRLTGKPFKKLRLAELLCADLQIDAHRLRPKPIYIEWQKDCRFTWEIPQNRLSDYRVAGETAFPKDRDIYAVLPQPKFIDHRQLIGPREEFLQDKR